MSHSLRAARVYVQWTMRIQTGRRLTPVTPYWLRPNGCAASYTVPGGGPPGSVDRRSGTWRVPADGRIVAAGGHLHAGARDLTLDDPGCRRRLLDARPLYGPPGDPVYAVRPVLHEPGPIATRYFLSRTGIPVRRRPGPADHRDLRRRAPARAGHVDPPPLPRAAAGPRPVLAARRCPRDRREVLPRRDGRADPPYEPVPFNVMDDQGPRRAGRRTCPGHRRRSAPGGTVDLVGTASPPRRSRSRSAASCAGASATPRSTTSCSPSGPAVVGSPTRRTGRRSARFRRPGTYRLFCPLHPITMHQEVVVGLSDR